MPCPSSVYGQNPNPPSFDWLCVANHSQRFPHSSLQRKVSGLTQTQQTRQHAFLEIRERVRETS